MPSIDVTQDVFERLQKHARPFVDTPNMVVQKALDALDQQTAGRAKSSALDARGGSLPEFEALQPPSLTFTKVVAAAFNGVAMKPANWNRLLDAALTHASKHITDFAKLQRIAAVNIVKGKKTDEGYHYLSAAGISVQGQDANAAWRGTVFIAQNLNCPVEVSFLWRNKEGAEHPGKPGSMRLN